VRERLSCVSDFSRDRTLKGYSSNIATEVAPTRGTHTLRSRSTNRLCQSQQIQRVAAVLVQRARAFVAGKYRQRHQLTMMFARPVLGMHQQRLAHAIAFVLRQHRQIGDMAVAASGEEIRGALQMDEAHPFAIRVLGHEQVAVRWLILKMPQQILADAFDAFVPASPWRQGEIHKTGYQREDEIVIVFGQTNQQGRVSHGESTGGRDIRCRFYTLFGSSESPDRRVRFQCVWIQEAGRDCAPGRAGRRVYILGDVTTRRRAAPALNRRP
jgi:hypothetical protein